jgi:hypothetical protein
MSKFDPERDGWGLPEAIMRTAHRDMLAALHRNIIDATGLTYQPIEWWIHRLAPPAAPPRHPPRPLDNLFRLHEESGRRWLIMQGSIETDFLHRLYSGELTCWGRLESSLAPYVRAPAGAITGIESWSKGGGSLRLESGEKLYSARIKPPTTSRIVPENEIADWLRSHPDMSQRDGLPAACRDLGGTIPRSRFRAVRKGLAISLPPGRKVNRAGK